MNDIKYIEGTKCVDLTGQKFNMLTVESLAYVKVYDKKTKNRAYYNCKCNCGNNSIVSSSALTTGGTKSCGCLKSTISERKKKTNRYEFFDNYVIGYDCNNKSFIIDTEDYDKIKDYCWTCSPFGYFCCTRKIDGKRVNMKLHRIIMDCKPYDNILIDHKNTLEKFDNRKSNLRVATRQQNMFNSQLAKNNASGFTGVYWSKKDKSWYSQINCGVNRVHLGYTKTKEQAIVQRLEAEVKYFGVEFAPQRHLFEEYNIDIEKFILQTPLQSPQHML